MLVTDNNYGLGKGDQEEKEDPINCIPDQDSVDSNVIPDWSYIHRMLSKLLNKSSFL